ncbi:MAG: DUF3192 domain-containing protein [Cellvibrionales bacterium]|nr:MAG: DUF3192 domain-containing protein [Cellvibrionales bacterium]
MIKNILVSFFLIMALSGCVSTSEIRAENRQKLTSLSPGMSKEEILSIMGTKTIKADTGVVVTNPYRTEMYKSNGHAFELLLYYTDIQKADGAITDDELTPLVMKDGKLDGWGWSYWNDIVKKYEIRIR